MPTGKKYGGRTAGVRNKKTEVAISRAERILRIIEAKYLEKDIVQLSAAQRMDLYGSLLEYTLPKLSRQEVSGSVNHKVIHVAYSDNIPDNTYATPRTVPGASRKEAV